MEPGCARAAYFSAAVVQEIYQQLQQPGGGCVCAQRGREGAAAGRAGVRESGATGGGKPLLVASNKKITVRSLFEQGEGVLNMFTLTRVTVLYVPKRMVSVSGLAL